MNEILRKFTVICAYIKKSLEIFQINNNEALENTAKTRKDNTPKQYQGWN